MLREIDPFATFFSSYLRITSAPQMTLSDSPPFLLQPLAAQETGLGGLRDGRDEDVERLRTGGLFSLDSFHGVL